MLSPTSFHCPVPGEQPWLTAPTIQGCVGAGRVSLRLQGPPSDCDLEQDTEGLLKNAFAQDPPHQARFSESVPAGAEGCLGELLPWGGSSPREGVQGQLAPLTTALGLYFKRVRESTYLPELLRGVREVNGLNKPFNNVTHTH